MNAQTHNLSRSQRLANLCQQSGATWLLQRLPKRDCLVVLNYHRIGHPELTIGDPGVISATPQDFAQQVEYLTKHFHVATLQEATDYVKQKRRTGKGLVLITFDDGYIDNYQVAFPILKSYNVQGVFFLTTSLVGTSCFPWWDAIAYRVKNSLVSTLRLNYPHPITFDLEREGANAVRQQLLKLYKSPKNTEPSRLMQEISEATGIPEIDSRERLFLDWNGAAEMSANGMAIGSHTHRHELLANLSVDQQAVELSISKNILEAKLGVSIDTLAYPVGSKTSFSQETASALQQSGYRTAFSFYGGVNLRGRIDPYDICRISVNPEPDSLFRLRTTVAALTGKCWI